MVALPPSRSVCTKTGSSLVDAHPVRRTASTEPSRHPVKELMYFLLCYNSPKAWRLLRQDPLQRAHRKRIAEHPYTDTDLSHAYSYVPCGDVNLCFVNVSASQSVCRCAPAQQDTTGTRQCELAIANGFGPGNGDATGSPAFALQRDAVRTRHWRTNLGESPAFSFLQSMIESKP